ncbi:hypothetical protein HCN56_05900 [Streptomyces lonarensis]|uniref:Uncharacterized protein n=1 Tax=Streptomyces lonarensis TaxID=700599 RepID=A0A7X6CZ81_9ACTN|nr:hypothetical protein [Streptomyces lonarensis]
MGHRYSLILDREVTEQEAVTLKETSRADISFASDTLPTNADVTVTRISFEDEVTPTLAEAIEAGFEAVKAIPGLSIPGLSVPAQPAAADGGEDGGSTKEEVEVTS